MQSSPSRSDGPTTVAVTASGARAPSPGFDYAFPPPSASDLCATFSSRHSRSHTTPILSADSSGYHPATPLIDLDLEATPAHVEYSSQTPYYTQPAFAFEIEGHSGPPQEEPNQCRLDRPARMRRTISHNPPVFPSVPYPAGSAAPTYPTESVTCEPFALDAPAAVACTGSNPFVSGSFSTDAEVAFSHSRLSGSEPERLPSRSGNSAEPSNHPLPTSVAQSFASSDASTCGIPLILTAGSLSPAWATTPTLETVATGTGDEVSPPLGAPDRLSPFDQEMQRSGSTGSFSSSSAHSYSTDATSATTVSDANRSQSPPEGGLYEVARDVVPGQLAPPRASSAGPTRSSSVQPFPTGQYPAINLPAPTLKLPRPAKCRNINRNVWLPPPQALLAPGVVAPSAGAIAAPNGRGTALFPGTDSPGIPTDQDYKRMVTKTARGRHPRRISDLGIPAALADGSSAPPTMEQLHFAGLTKTGHPKRVYVCKAPDCERVFKRSEHLKRHVRSIHTYEKPFQCQWPTCKKFFTRHDNLKQHLRVHRHPTQTDEDFSALLQKFFAQRHEDAKEEQAQWQEQQGLHVPRASSGSTSSATASSSKKPQSQRPKLQRDEAARGPPAPAPSPRPATTSTFSSAPPQSLQQAVPASSSSERLEQASEEDEEDGEEVDQLADDDEDDLLGSSSPAVDPDQERPIAMAWQAATGQPLWPSPSPPAHDSSSTSRSRRRPRHRRTSDDAATASTSSVAAMAAESSQRANDLGE
ncbi:hypothetical protein RHOSPDRAFT_25833 [Rhodotorula sp. JG-1b]|nr:hypothetical protein RHOSPDRAFT_25833 [Rhodotorula sp. JG-1b]